MVRLRPYKRCDAQYIVSWIKDEVAFRKWCADRYEKYPISAEDMNAQYDSLAEKDNFYQMTAFDDSGIVGHLIMRFIDEEKKVLRFGFVIVDASKQGKGYGKEMLSLALKYAFEILKVEKVTLGVFENNMQAYHCYKAVGFKDVVLDKEEYYHVLGEDWKCLELEIAQKTEKCEVDAKELLSNLDKLHTTELGVERIKRNLSLDIDNVVKWCQERAKDVNAAITREGKNWYVSVDGCIITINAYSYTIITAHKKK